MQWPLLREAVHEEYEGQVSLLFSVQYQEALKDSLSA